MLSTKVFSSGSNAQNYYSHADYYGAEATGVWFGEGAKDFNVSGIFDAKDSKEFKDLLDGRMPDGRVLGKKGKDNEVNHRPGADLTFSSPKSISVEMHVLGDKESKLKLEGARDLALARVLKHIESSGMVHTRKGDGGFIREPIHKLTFALFNHTTNRKLEPQDHTHCFLANATKCNDGKYRTIVWDEVLKNNKYLGQMYRNELALEVKKLGYDIRVTRLSDGSSSFELAKVPQQIIDGFSTRRKEIEALFKYYDVKTKAGRDRIVINSRESKKTLPKEQLQDTWKQVLEKVNSTKEQSNSGLGIKASIQETTRVLLDKTIYRQDINQLKEQQVMPAKDMVSLAIKNITYNHSVFKKDELFKETMKYSIGEYSFKEIDSAIQGHLKDTTILKSDHALHSNLFTTKELLEKEKDILRIGSKGLNKCTAIIKEGSFQKSFKSHELEHSRGYSLNKQQVAAVKHIITSKDRVTAIQGLPGVGKSTVLKTVRSMYGDKVIALGAAPTASASNTLEESSGIRSKTLHSFISQYRGYLEGRGTKVGLERTQASLSKSTVFIDEASLIGTRQMHDLLNLSESLKFRVVLVGDIKQLPSVEAGKPFEQLLEKIKAAELSTVIRQRVAKHKEAVAKVASGKILESFEIHKENIKGSSQFVHQSVRTYLSLTDAEQKSTLLIAPSKEHRDKINNSIVEKLSATNNLGKVSQKLEVLKPSEFKSSDYNFSSSYKAGDIVKFNKDYSRQGIKKGDSLVVDRTQHKTNVLLFKSGLRNIRFQLKAGIDYQSKLEVFQKDTLAIKEGILLRFTKNDQGLVNSETARVTNLDQKHSSVTLELSHSKKSITLPLQDLKHVDYGYCSTVHSSQGKTTDRLIAAICSNNQLNNQKSWLVSISRQTQNLHIYMQDETKVKQQLISNKGIEKSALNIKVQGKERQVGR